MVLLKGISTLLVLLVSVQESYAADGLYVSNSTHILFQVDGSVSEIPVSVYSGEGSRIVGLAVDVADKYIFWSDISFGNLGIYRGQISDDGTLSDFKKIVNDVGEVNGLAVDYVRKHVYWTDCTRHSIEVADYEGENRVVLTIDKLVSPRGIAVDVKNGFLFWNDQDTKKIERSSLDGSARIDFVGGADSDVQWPNQMAVLNDYLYCVDGKTLNVMQYKVTDGTPTNLGSTHVFGANANTNHPFGIAVDNFHAYVTIWYSSRSVVKFSLDNLNEDAEVLRSLGTDPIFSLAYFKALTQPTVTDDPCASNSCEHMCLPHGKSDHSCACPTFSGEALQAGDTCSEPKNIMFYVLADEGIVAYKDLDGKDSLFRNIVGRSLRPVAVAYDPVEKMVYYSDVHERTIHRSRLDGSDHTIFMSSSSHSLGVVDSMVIDPVGRKLYFSNMGSVSVYDNSYHWGRIEFIGLDGMGRKTIVDSVEMPRGLYLDHEEGQLYYTDWGDRPSIVRVNLDGSELKVIRISGLDNPNSITKVGNKFYVLDSHYKTRDEELNPNYPGNKENGALYSFNGDGSGWQKETVSNLVTPFGLTAYNNKLYITDWDKEAIYEHTPGGNTVSFMQDVVDPMSVLYSPATMIETVDSCINKTCDEVCVVSAGTAECLCDSYKTSVLLKGGSCGTPEYFVLVGDFNAIKLIDLSVPQEPGSELREPQVLLEGSSYFSNFVSLAFDESSKLLYHSDVNRQAIYVTSLENPISSDMVTEIAGVVDGMHLYENKLYWTAFANGSIHYTDLSDNTSRTLVTGRDRPRAITVFGDEIYWTEWGDTPQVVRASKTDGSGLTVLVKGNNLVRPNGLDVDTENIYIGEAENARIIKCDRDGSNCAAVEVIGENRPHHIYSIKKKANRIYYTDWEAGTVSLMLLNGAKSEGSIIHLAENLMRPTEIIIKTDTVQGCQGNGGCSDECLPYFGGITCSCPSGKYLSDDGKTCKAVDELQPCPYGGNEYKVGEDFEPDSCVSCACTVDKTFGNPNYGNAVCEVKTCPVLTCDENYQVTDAGDCCAHCQEGLCDTDPIGIDGCASGTMVEKIELPSDQAYVEHTFNFQGVDNCHEFRTVTVTAPDENKFWWQADPYQLKATAKAPNSEGGEDSFTCNIQLEIRDDTPPTLTCPTERQTLYYTGDELYCIEQPEVTDNVCGRSGNADCIVEGRNCQKFSVNVHNVEFTAKDAAGNQDTCTVTVNVENVPTNLKCTPFNVNNGQVECTEEQCAVKCNSGAEPNLLNGNGIYRCQSDGTFEPELPERIDLYACPKVFSQRLILVDTLNGLPCPTYSVIIVTTGLEVTIKSKYIDDKKYNNLSLPIQAKVTPENSASCSRERRRRDTDDLALKIQLSTTFQESQDPNEVEAALVRIMGAIRQDIIKGILLPNDIDSDQIDESNFERDPVSEACLEGEIKSGDKCVQCPVGTKSNEDKCELCGLHTYNDKPGSEFCKVCPPGKETTEKGAQSRSQCIEVRDTSPPDDSTKVEGTSGSNNTTIIIIAVVAAVVVATIIIVVVIVVRRRKNKADKEDKNPGHFDNPVFKEGADVYEEPPFVLDDQAKTAAATGVDMNYQALARKQESDMNPYDNLQKSADSNSNSVTSDAVYMEPN